MKSFYLDTSVAITESFLKSPYCEAFVKACAVLNFAVVLPQIVLDELQGKYPKKLQEKFASLQKAKKELEKIIDLPIFEVTEDEAVLAYDDWLGEFVVKHGIVVLPYPEMPLSELVKQSYAATKPFKESGEGHKDYIIWASIRANIEGESEENSKFFLTNNTNDFCASDENGNFVLHPDLAATVADQAKMPKVFTSIKSAFENELSPLLEGISPDDIPDLGSEGIAERVGAFLDDDLSGHSAFGFNGVPFTNDVTVSSVDGHVVNNVALKRVDNEVIISVEGTVDIGVDGFIDKTEYYMSEDDGLNMYVVDGNWNDHVMMVSASVATPFEMTIFYSTDSGTVTKHETSLPDEIEDEWPYK